MAVFTTLGLARRSQRILGVTTQTEKPDWSRVGTRLPVLQTEKLRHGGVMPPSQAPPVSPWLTLPTLPPFIPLSLFNRVTEGLLPQTHYYMMPDSSLKMCKDSFSDKYLNKQVGAGDM